ncbi:MAG: aminodeoxychorismate/anthranilate synthase component II [Desulfobacterales bacterium]|nr:aminodeoxychorismate/anthranilate synthase component II [Desulfobacterales bacterium]
MSRLPDQGPQASARRGRRPGERLRVLMVDNYDSFTYNLVQYLGELGADVAVFRNDADRRGRHPRPLRPDGAGPLAGPLHARRGRRAPWTPSARFGGALPILGVCLGHQAIGQAFGGRVVRNAAHRPRQGQPGAPRRRAASSPACPRPSRPAATTRWWWSARRCRPASR